MTWIYVMKDSHAIEHQVYSETKPAAKRDLFIKYTLRSVAAFFWFMTTFKFPEIRSQIG
jgi:hypothetical protein